MMNINLLPYKEEQRRYFLKIEMLFFLGLFLLLLTGLFSGWAFFDKKITNLDLELSSLNEKIQKSNTTVQEVVLIKKEIDIASKKIQIVDQLKKIKLLPVHILDDIASVVSEDPHIWLVSIKEQNGSMVISGGALEHSNVSQFQMALKKKAKYLLDVKLQKIETEFQSNKSYLRWSVVCALDYK
jgi:type IV pilus assembly protein PilN